MPLCLADLPISECFCPAYLRNIIIKIELNNLSKDESINGPFGLVKMFNRKFLLTAFY